MYAHFSDMRMVNHDTAVLGSSASFIKFVSKVVLWYYFIGYDYL